MKPALAPESLTHPLNDPVLRRLRAELDALYGERLERVVLFGSRARGQAVADSDYDVAVFLADVSDPAAEWRIVSGLTSALFEETGEQVHAMPFRAGGWRDRTPLMHDIRHEGIDVGPRRRPPPAPPCDQAEPGSMSPEAAFFIERARKLLGEAQANLGIDLAEQAGRIGYSAALNAAQGFIFERSGRVVKTHKGVKSRFNLLTRSEPGVDSGLREFLEQGYRLKTIADYPSPSDPQVTPEMAREAVETATRFVETIAALLEASALP